MRPSLLSRGSAARSAPSSSRAKRWYARERVLVAVALGLLAMAGDEAPATVLVEIAHPGEVHFIFAPTAGWQPILKSRVTPCGRRISQPTISTSSVRGPCTP